MNEVENIPIETKAKWFFELLKFVFKVTVAAIPVMYGFVEIAETKFESYMEARDERIVIELTEGIAGTTIVLERLELAKYRTMDSLSLIRLLDEHWTPAMITMLEMKTDVDIMKERSMATSASIAQIQSDLLESGRNKQSKTEAELNWYKQKAVRDDIERRLDLKMIKLDQRKDSIITNEVKQIRRVLEQSAIKTDRVR